MEKEVYTLMKIMIISYLHYEHGIHHGIVGSIAWSWLINIVKYHNPYLLLSCGDWGTAITPECFYELLELTTVLTIYGNHENIDVLRTLHNIRTNENLPVLIPDGEVVEYRGIRIAGINGIISIKKRHTEEET